MRNSDSFNINTEHRTSSLEEDLSHLNGATIVDENGKEIPITDEMIQQACNDLLEAIN